jgi:glutaredoxin 3
VLELYQAEWCPHSRKVRQRLTELGVDFVARQVAAEPRDRRDMRARTGEIEIPVLVGGSAGTLTGEDEILAWLDRTFDEHPDAGAHRAKALDKAGLPG